MRNIGKHEGKHVSPLFNANHWHRLWKNPTIIGVKSNITTFSYVCRIIVYGFIAADDEAMTFCDTDWCDIGNKLIVAQECHIESKILGLWYDIYPASYLKQLKSVDQWSTRTPLP